MRVLHAYKIYRPDIEGGIPAVIANLVTSPSTGTTHRIFCARRRGLGGYREIDGTQVCAVASVGTLFSTPMAPTYIPGLARLFRSSDIVVHHAPMPLTDAAITLGLPDHVGLIVYWHADIVGYRLLRWLASPLLRRVLERADQIIVSGQAMIDHSPWLRKHTAKCLVVPFGMDIDFWRMHPAGNVERSPAATQRFASRQIVALGRLVPYKGYDVLLRALQTVDATLTIIGEGPLLRPLQELAAELGVSERTQFPGRLAREDIRKLFHSAAVFAFPSVSAAEAFGLVQVEAMAAGLPIVNTSLLTPVPGVARHNHEALTVPPGDHVALSRALTRILDDHALAERLSRAAQSRAAEFDASIFRTRMETIYHSVLDRRKSSGHTSLPARNQFP